MPVKSKEEPHVPASLIPVKEEAKELPRRVWSLNPAKIKNLSDVRSKIPSSKYDRTKYATAKYAPTVECSTKYEVTVDDARANMCKSILVAVRRSLSSSQLLQPIQDTAKLNNGSSIKIKRGSTCNVRSFDRCSILNEFCSDCSEKALTASTIMAEVGLSASVG